MCVIGVLKGKKWGTGGREAIIFKRKFLGWKRPESSFKGHGELQEEFVVIIINDNYKSSLYQAVS